MTRQEICVIDLDGDNGKGGDGGLVSLYGKILKTISALPQENKNCVTLMIDDVSLMEVAARGSTNLVLDFLHYCHTLVSEFVSNQLKMLFVFSVCNTFTQFSCIYHHAHFVATGMFLSHAHS